VSFTEKIEYDEEVTVENPFPNRIETDNLVLKGPITEHETLGEIHRFHQGEVGKYVTKYNSFEKSETLEDTHKGLFEYCVESWNNGEAAYYAIYEKERSGDYDFDFCGVAGMVYEWDRQSAEIAVWLHPDVWGNEYASERAEALLDVVFNHPVKYGIEVVNIYPMEGNENSVKSVNKYIDELGGRRIGIKQNAYVFDGLGPTDVVEFQISKDEFNNSRY